MWKRVRHAISFIIGGALAALLWWVLIFGIHPVFLSLPVIVYLIYAWRHRHLRREVKDDRVEAPSRILPSKKKRQDDK